MAAIPQAAHEDTLPGRLARLARSLQDRYLGKDEVSRLLLEFLRKARAGG